MAESTQVALLEYLGQHYLTLKQRLTRRLGSVELAGDALHDTWLRLRSSEAIGPVRDPGAYVARMAVNVAVDAQRRNSRMLSGDDIDALLAELADAAPGPERHAEVGADLAALSIVLERMPARRRAVALLVHAEGLTQKETAQRLNVSLRTVEYELQRIHERLDTCLGRPERA